MDRHARTRVAIHAPDDGVSPGEEVIAMGGREIGRVRVSSRTMRATYNAARHEGRARTVRLKGDRGSSLHRVRNDTWGLRIAQVCLDQAPDVWAERRAAGYDPRNTRAVDRLIRALAARLARVLPVAEFLLDDWYDDADRALAPGGAEGAALGEERPYYHDFLPVLYHEPYALDLCDYDPREVGPGEAMLAFAMLRGFPHNVDLVAGFLEEQGEVPLGRTARRLARALGDDAMALRLYNDAGGVFAAAPTPYDAVPAFLRYATATTGHKWLDRTADEFPEFDEVDWTVDAIREARAGYDAATAYMAPLRVLCDHIATPQGFATLADLIARVVFARAPDEETGETHMTDVVQTAHTHPATPEIETQPTPIAADAAVTSAAPIAAEGDGDGVMEGERPQPEGPPALPERKPGYIQVEECVARAFGLHQALGLTEAPVIDVPADDDGGPVEVTLSLSRCWGFAVKTLHDERGLPYAHTMISAGEIAGALGQVSRQPALKDEGVFLDLPATSENGLSIKGLYVPGRRIAPLKQVGSKNVRFGEMPIPNHIILATSEGQRRTFYMWAVLRYPSSPRDAVFAMPVNNVMDRTGWVCVGDVTLPQAAHLALHTPTDKLNLGDIDRRLLDDSRYNNSYNENKSKTYPRNLDDLWRWLATLPTAQGYPYEDLVQVGTIEEILAGRLGRGGML